MVQQTADNSQDTRRDRAQIRKSQNTGSQSSETLDDLKELRDVVQHALFKKIQVSTKASALVCLHSEMFH